MGAILDWHSCRNIFSYPQSLETSYSNHRYELSNFVCFVYEFMVCISCRLRNMYHRQTHWFTLMEMLTAITIFFLIMTTVLGVYRQMVTIKADSSARQALIQQSYFTLEKINTLLRDYSIDYEEYFNRQLVGCNTVGLALRDVGTGASCGLFTHYGNANSIDTFIINGDSQSWHHLYYCSSSIGTDETMPSYPRITFKNTSVNLWWGCYQYNPWRFTQPQYQSFGQYALQHIDVADEVNSSLVWSAGDDDDKDLGIWPVALMWGSWAQELYLISPSKDSRIFIRRQLLGSGDRDNDGITGNSSVDRLYSLQILRLKGFDAGTNHDFNVTTSSGVYDGKIDTRACDLNEWFICQWQNLGWAYTGYRLPASTSDGWISLLWRDLTVSERSLSINPDRDPSLSRISSGSQISSYVTIRFTTNLYGEYRRGQIPANSLKLYGITLQTSFTNKQRYTAP